VCFAGGCEYGNVAAPQTTVEQNKPVPTEIAGVQVGQWPQGHPVVEGLGVLSRGPRRLSVDQLERSIEVILKTDRGTVVLPADLAATLGRPDYRRVTEESLEPSPLFMKFMMDLAKFVCDGIVDLDAARPDQVILTRYSDVDTNLDHLMLRFWGLEGEAATPYRDRLRSAYDSASASLGAAAGWEAVCLSLATSPEFLIY